jgi:hypothetical protein
MFTACIFCHTDLGRNGVVERFAVGRRLAFDQAKGRLWVVCSRCERWNLTPLEERWEAIEECEELFRGTRLRASTGNVGLARLGDGTELVRIGAPLRAEFAAWRYGDQFGRRRRRAITRAAAGVAVGGAILIGGPVTGLLVGGTGVVAHLALNAYQLLAFRKGLLHLPLPEGGYVIVPPEHQAAARLIEVPDDRGWALEVPYADVVPSPGRWWRATLAGAERGRVRLAGAHAVHAVGRLLPFVNRSGATAERTREAVRLIEEAGGPARIFPAAAANLRRWAAQQRWGDTAAVGLLPHAVRLALEMAAHEESERRALEGELILLEQAWRDAEEVARIADDLLLPAGVEAFIRKQKTASSVTSSPRQ